MASEVSKRIHPIALESVDSFGALFPGAETVSAERVARACQRSLEGAKTGKSYRMM
jgi:hypothetical protein